MRAKRSKSTEASHELSPNREITIFLLAYQNKMPTSPTELQASLERHNHTFESLLNLIPPKYYIVNDDDDGNVHHNQFQKNKKQKAPKQVVKEATKKARKNKVRPYFIMYTM